MYAGTMAGAELPSPVRNDNSKLVGEGPYADNAVRYYSTGLTYRLDSDGSVRTDYTYNTTRTRRNESVLFLQNQAGDYQDYRSDYGEAYAYNQWQAMLEGRFATGPLKHQVVIGASWQKQKNDYSSNGVYQLQGTGNVHSKKHKT